MAVFSFPEIGKLFNLLLPVFGTRPFGLQDLAQPEKLLFKHPFTALPQKFHIGRKADIALVTGGIHENCSHPFSSG